MKKILVSLLIGVLLSASLAGCGTPAASAQSEPKAESEAPSQASLDKNIKMKICVPDNAGVSGYESGASENNNRFLNAIKKETGYANLEWQVIPQANAIDTYSMMFASGDNVDLIYNSDMKIYKKFLGQNALKNISEELSLYGNVINNMVPADAWMAMTDNGKIYGIPVPNYQEINGNRLGQGMIMRTDWLDAINMTAPRTTEELYNVLKAFKDNNLGGENTVPFVANAAGNPNPLSGLAPLIAPFSITIDYIVADDKIYPSEDLNLKKALKYLAQLYAEGLIDNEYLFTNDAQVTEKLSSGKAGAVYAGYWSLKPYRDGLAVSEPDGVLEYVPVVVGPDGYSGFAMAAPVSNFHMVPSSSKYAAQAIDLINTYLSNEELMQFVNFGEEGVHYTFEDNKLVPIKPAYDDIIYKIYYRLWTTPEVWRTNAGLAGYTPAIESWDKSGNQLTAIDINYYKPPLATESRMDNTFTDMKNEYVAKIITGAWPLDKIDEYFAAKEKDPTMQQARKELEEWFDSTGRDIYNSIK